MSSSGVRLTELASLAGCAGKAGAEALQFVLGHLQAIAGSEDGLAEPDEVLVGLREPDDAAVYRLSDEQALVVTIDFFAPLVDDPYSYGAISAANAVSDIYAMGADVAFALNVSGFPIDLDQEVVSEILRGGAEKMAEAGGVIVGGHTIIDAEPKYGLCVLGFVHPDRIFTKAGARPGETLYLTKPLGTGLITTAAMFEEAEPAHLEAAIESMSRLNQAASRIVRDMGVCALTDVTGFGILGHGYEMADASGVELCLDASALPLLPGAMEYAHRGVVSGGGFRNREHLEGHVSISSAIPEDMQHVLYDPQTSGGLLFSLPPDRAATVEEGFARADMPLWRIGEVVEGHGVTVVP